MNKRFTALVHVPGQGMRRFEEPLQVLVATTPEEVHAVLDTVESACRDDGCIAVGYVAYEAASAFDDALVTHPSNGPLAEFAIFADSTPEDIQDAITQPNPAQPIDVTSRVKFADYETSIDAIRSLIEAGDTYQVNYTHLLDVSTQASPLAAFASMYSRQPGELAAYIDTENTTICSASPELFFERQGNVVRSEPMKGTAPRSPVAADDQQMRDNLLASKKDLAENLMIVDMVRNDLGRIAEAGSVNCPDLFTVRALPTLWQMISTVEATTSASLAEIFGALFPCASITGAPKVRSMQIIRELEPEPRGVYTGAIGLVLPGGDARFSVAIRTLQVSQDRACYGVGGGVVWNSTAEAEWRESLAKSRIFKPVDFSLLGTMRWTEAEGIYLLEEHVERLLNSAARFEIPLVEGNLRQALEDLALVEDSLVRLLVNKQGDVTIESRPLPAAREKVRLRISPFSVSSGDEMLLHKTTRRELYEQASMGCDDCDDVVLWNERSEVTETAICNIFINREGRLLTPPLSSGTLPGTLRRHLIEAGEAEEMVITIDDLHAADEIFVGNSVRGLEPAVLLRD